MDNVIEPGTGVLNTAEDPNQNGGLPVMSEETIANAQPPSKDSAPVEFYTLDNDEYKPVLDILYPPGTQFYAKNPDGTFVPTGVQPGEVAKLPDDLPAMPTITLDQMIATGKSFLEKNGYVVTAASEYESTAELKNQIATLKDQLVALHKPVKTGDRSFELGILFGKIRSMINSHMPSHALTSEAHETVNKIEELM